MHFCLSVNSQISHVFDIGCSRHELYESGEKGRLAAERRRAEQAEESSIELPGIGKQTDGNLEVQFRYTIAKNLYPKRSTYSSRSQERRLHSTTPSPALSRHISLGVLEDLQLRRSPSRRIQSYENLVICSFSLQAE